MLALSAGCSLPSGAKQGDEANLTREPRPHAEAVLACAASFEERAGSSPSHDALADYAACLEAADRIVQPEVESLVAQVNAGLAAQADLRIDEYRGGAESLCSLLARTKQEDVDAEVACAVDVERLLADLIDAYVDLGAPPRPIAEARAQHGDCYAAFDAAPVETDVELRGATEELALCIEDRTRLRRPLIAQALAEAGTDDAPELVAQRFDAVADSTLVACEIVAAASDARGGKLARLYSASCRVDVAHRIDAVVAAD